MQMRDFNELLDAKEEARKKLLVRCYGVASHLATYRRDVILDIWGEKVLKELDELELAYESASRDLDECLSVATEAASFREANNAD